MSRMMGSKRTTLDADIVIARRFGGRVLLRANRYEDRWEMPDADFEELKRKHPEARILNLSVVR